MTEPNSEKTTSSWLKIAILLIIAALITAAVWYLTQVKPKQEEQAAESAFSEPELYNEDGTVNIDALATDIPQDETNENNLKTFTNDHYGFSVNYPADWKKGLTNEPTDQVLETGWEEIAMYLFEPKSVVDPSTLYSSTAGAFVFKNKLNDTENIGSKEAWFIYVRNKYKDYEDNQYQPQSEEMADENKYGGFAVKLKYDSEELYRTAEELWVLRDKEVFFLQTYAPTDAYENYQTIFSALFDSFKLN